MKPAPSKGIPVMFLFIGTQYRLQNWWLSRGDGMSRKLLLNAHDVLERGQLRGRANVIRLIVEDGYQMTATDAEAIAELRRYEFIRGHAVASGEYV